MDFMKCIKKSKKNGFTIIEVIAVLLLISIVSAVVAVRMSDTAIYDLSSQVEVIKTHLRYAQIRAMDTNTPWGINFTSPTTYYLFEGSGSETPVILPDEAAATVNLATKNSDLVITPPGRVTFDTFGSPGAATITIPTNGGTITVTRNTGFIP